MSPDFFVLVRIGPIIVLLFGSVVLVRSARNRTTILMVVGSSIALLAMAWVAVLEYVSFGPFLYTFLSELDLSASLLVLGTTLFCVGFLGICAKHSKLVERTSELEALNLQLLERMQEDQRSAG